MKNTTRLLALLFITLAMVFAPVMAHATSGSPTPTATPSFKEAHPELTEAIKNAKEVRKTVRTEDKEERQLSKEDRCTNINARIENRLNQYDDSKEKYNNRYQGVVKMLKDLMAKLKTRGCDTATVETNLTTFEGLIEDLAAAFRVFIDSLKGSQAFVCGTSEGKFAGAIRTSQTNLQTVKTKAEGLRTYYKNTLRPSVATLKTTCKELLKSSPKPTESPVSTTEGE